MGLEKAPNRKNMIIESIVLIQLKQIKSRFKSRLFGNVLDTDHSWLRKKSNNKGNRPFVVDCEYKQKISEHIHLSEQSIHALDLFVFKIPQSLDLFLPLCLIRTFVSQYFHLALKEIDLSLVVLHF